MRARFIALITIISSLSFLTIGYAAQNGQSQPPAQPQAQSQTPAAPAGGETAGQSKQFTNIQVMKDIPADQVIPSMEFIKGALGVDCNFCHVTDKGHAGFALDDKRAKKTAREMMIMTNTINQNPAVDKHVTCATCHQGHNQPINNAPVLDEATWQERVDAKARQAQFQQQRAANGGQASAPGATGSSAAPQQSREERQKAAQAGADAAFQKYLDAVGGQAAVAKLKSLQEKGTTTTPHGDTSNFEVIRSTGDKVAFTQTAPKGSFKLVYNGSEAVAESGGHANPVTGFELNALKLDAGILRNIDLKPQYSRAQALPFTQKIEGKECTVVRAALPNGQGQETLYFDFLSGLLLRRVVVLRTAMGGITQQTDFSDYRDVNGVKIAFVAKIATDENIQTRTITEAKINVPVSDDTFKLPAVETAHPGGN
jgi:hypothetical protein